MKRREFLSLVGVGMAGVTTALTGGATIASAAESSASSGASSASSTAASDTAAADSYVQSIDWSAEFDVVVIGSGLAGVCTSITAQEAGAHVLLVEKGPIALRGGDSRFAGGGLIGYSDGNRDAFATYCKEIIGAYGENREDVVDAFADAIDGVQQWLDDRGCNSELNLEGVGENPELDGADALNWYLEDNTRFTAGMYNKLMAHLESLDNIDIWYSSPATALIKNPCSQVVEGVTVTVEDAEYNVRALNGVVICTGGFLADQSMVRDFMHLPECHPKGSSLNTGDGIKLATSVGAALCNMTNCDGPNLDVVDPVTGVSYAGGAILMRGYVEGIPNLTSGFMINSAIFVGPDATRFCDEASLPNEGYTNFHGRWIVAPLALPAYAVFDQAAYATPIYPVWGTNDDKLADGVIVQADTIEELAGLIDLDPDALAQTIQTYNGYCDQGEDPEFNRAPEHLVAFSETGPYYAVEVKATSANSMGGPRRNGKAEILDTSGDPILHLYGDGDCGSMWADRYQGGADLAECIAFGIIAGNNAASQKDDNLRDSVMEGKDPVDFTVEPVTFAPEADDEHIARADGIGGPLWVKVVVDGDKITSVEILYNNETPGIGQKAVDAIPQRIVDAQSAEVDAITGATTSSNTIMKAVASALDEAGFKA